VAIKHIDSAVETRARPGRWHSCLHYIYGVVILLPQIKAEIIIWLIICTLLFCDLHSCLQCDSIFPSRQALDHHRQQMDHYDFVSDYESETTSFESDDEEGLDDDEEERERLLWVIRLWPFNDPSDQST